MTILSWGFVALFAITAVKAALWEIAKPELIKILEKKFSHVPLARWIFYRMAQAEKRKDRVIAKLEKRYQKFGWILGILFDSLDDIIEALFRL